MTSILEFGLMSQAIYEDTPTVPGWTCVNYRPGLGSGLQATTFTRGQTVVVAFKGTTPSQVSDLVADLKIGTGMNTSYYSAAEQYVARYADAPGVVVTGHSLGGAIAQTVGNRRRIPFVSFNAPGVAIMASQNVMTTTPLMTAIRVTGGIASTFRHPMQAFRDMSSAFHDSLGVNFRLSGDLVSRIGLHYGPIVNLAATGGPGDQHSIDLVVDRLGDLGYRDINFPG